MDTIGKLPGLRGWDEQAGEGYAGDQGSQGAGPRVRLMFGIPRHRSDSEVVRVGVLVGFAGMETLIIFPTKRGGMNQPDHPAECGEDENGNDAPDQHYAASAWGEGFLRAAASASSSSEAHPCAANVIHWSAGMLSRWIQERTV